MELFIYKDTTAQILGELRDAGVVGATEMPLTFTKGKVACADSADGKCYVVSVDDRVLIKYVQLVGKYHKLIEGVISLVTPLLSMFKKDCEELAEFIEAE